MQEWCFKVDGFMSLLPRILAAVNALDKGKQYVLTIKQKTKRRSLDANAYCWVLLDRLYAGWKAGMQQQPPMQNLLEQAKREAE